VILTGTRDNRLQIGLELGADHVINAKNEDPVAAVRRLNGGKGVDYVIECSGAPDAVNEAARMVNRGGRIVWQPFRQARRSRYRLPRAKQHLLFGIRGEGKSATHSRRGVHGAEAFRCHEGAHPYLRSRRSSDCAALCRERIEDAIKVVVKTHGHAAINSVAAE